LEHEVARVVAVGVVDLFQAVEVEIVRDVTAATSSSPLSVRRATMCW